MGEVYLAEHQLLRRLCAIKLIRADRAASTPVQQRFKREAQVMANLRHPNIVEVFDYGVTPDGTFFYVMEYLSGQTLRELVEDSGPLPPLRAIAFLRQIAAALGAAHSRGLIHRDIKPSNIIVLKEGGSLGTVKLVDFGLVHIREPEEGVPLTEDGRLLGTPAFMSPEQIAGSHALDARSDIYSAGLVAYYVLMGRNPFERPEVRQIFAAHLSDVAPPMNLPAADLEEVVRRCLAKDPADRFPDAEALEKALAACAAAS
jgi:serine/threonine-protein kinase